MVNYSYLSDGTKLSALDGNGEGLVYRVPFVYRKGAGNGNSSLTLESAAFGGGRLTPTGAMLYVTDYLGSVRAVVNGKTGELYKESDYWAGQLECLYLDPADSRYSVFVEVNVPYRKLISNIGEINYNFIIHIIEDWKYLYQSVSR